MPRVGASEYPEWLTDDEAFSLWMQGVFEDTPLYRARTRRDRSKPYIVCLTPGKERPVRVWLVDFLCADSLDGGMQFTSHDEAVDYALTMVRTRFMTLKGDVAQG